MGEIHLNNNDNQCQERSSNRLREPLVIIWKSKSSSRIFFVDGLPVDSKSPGSVMRYEVDDRECPWESIPFSATCRNLNLFLTQHLFEDRCSTSTGRALSPIASLISDAPPEQFSEAETASRWTARFDFGGDPWKHRAPILPKLFPPRNTVCEWLLVALSLSS